MQGASNQAVPNRKLAKIKLHLLRLIQKNLLCWRAEHGVIDTVQQEESARPSSSCTKNAVKKEEKEATETISANNDVSPKGEKEQQLKDLPAVHQNPCPTQPMRAV